jgi:predicted esterase
MSHSRSFFSFFLLLALLGGTAATARPRAAKAEALPPQDTGFLNRQVVVRGVVHRFQVYLPEQWRRDDKKLWPVILFLHGRGERGSEGMWQTQVGLPAAVRSHPERWTFVIVMPQCPLGSFWTDPEQLTQAMEALDMETAEFHGDPERTYLTGLSMGGYGAWELLHNHPHRWAAVTIASSSIFWGYAPERWQRAATLPTEYARALGHTGLWMFHGTDDPIVPIKGDELTYEAIKAQGGRVRYWIFQGVKHDSWTRAFNEPELPRWLLTHRIENEPPSLKRKDGREVAAKEPPPYAERIVFPLHPTALRLTPAQMDALAGEYGESRGRWQHTLFRQGDELVEKDVNGEYHELAADSANTLFYPKGSNQVRIVIERDGVGRITALVLRDDRHEERWVKRQTQGGGGNRR